MAIDLNADVGEGAAGDAALFGCITSANIACGGHAGDEASMMAAASRALAAGVAVGAHPGYEDRKHFGRTEQALPLAEVKALVARQVRALQAVAQRCGARVTHVKPHGALYNQAARDPALAAAIAGGVAEIDPGMVLFGLSGSESIAAAQRAGLRTASEVFADRRYQADGSLVPRSRGESALIASADEAVRQVLQMVRTGTVTSVSGETVPVVADTVCLHGDSAGAVEFARRVRAALQASGLAVEAAARRFR